MIGKRYLERGKAVVVLVRRGQRRRISQRSHPTGGRVVLGTGWRVLSIARRVDADGRARRVRAHIHKGTLHTYATLFGLLACTGLRISEALGLRRDKTNLKQGIVTVKESKRRRFRLVPLRPSAVPPLQEYSAKGTSASLRPLSFSSTAVAITFPIRLFAPPHRPSAGGNAAHLCQLPGAFSKALLQIGLAKFPSEDIQDFPKQPTLWETTW
jgi:integrase